MGEDSSGDKRKLSSWQVCEGVKMEITRYDSITLLIAVLGDRSTLGVFFVVYCYQFLPAA